MAICSECGAEMQTAAQTVHDVTVAPPQVVWQICAACVRPGESMVRRAAAWQERQAYLAQQATAQVGVSYVIVLRDHAGDWHGVDLAHTWDEAWAIYHGAIGALRVIDYYPDYPPDVLKIVASRSGAAALDFATAPALGEPQVPRTPTSEGTTEDAR